MIGLAVHSSRERNKDNVMKKRSLFITLFFTASLLWAQSPLIAVDDEDLVKDTDILLKAEEQSKAIRLEEAIVEGGKPTKIEVIVDSSGSMGQILVKNKSKMYYLKQLMKEFFKARYKEKQNTIGLRVYSGITRDKCTDIRMVIPFGQNNLDKMQDAVTRIQPLGMTPLHQSLKFAFEDLKNFDGPKRVVVVTDGQDTCGGDPCATTEEWQKQNLDLKFYVIALGFKGDSQSFKKVQCIGDTQIANDDESFGDALGQIGKKLNNQDNLEVISPNPMKTVYLYQVIGKEKKLFRVFYAYSAQTVPPGKYEAVLALDPPYKFSEFTIKPKRKTILKVHGDGQLQVNFFNNLVNVEVLDKNNRVIVRSKSDKPMTVQTGKWRVRIFKDPFYEYIINDYWVYPYSKNTIDLTGLGAVKVKSEKPSGIYVYNEKKVVGQTITNSTAILKAGVYTIHVNDKCSFPDVNVKDKKEVLVLACPR
jgi:Ca-activated chloride channel homolog